MRREDEPNWPALRIGIEAVLAEYRQRNGVFADTDRQRLLQALDAKDTKAVRDVLATQTLLAVWINPESRVKVARGKAVADLTVNRPGVFLVEIANDAGAKAEMRVRVASGPERPDLFTAEFVQARTVTNRLDGNTLQYLLVTVRCREVGRREASFSLDAGQGTQDIGFRGEVPVLFRVLRTEP